ncbi:MAG: SRPBCC family protein [Candidatus Methylomirabilales bacterium]
MDPVILRIRQSVDVAAPAPAVYDLVSDPAAKARLNPFVQVIRIERETPGPLREGSVTFFRAQKGKQIYEYRTRCCQVVPGRLIENRADLPSLFRVRVEVEPVAGGSRLTQQEELEITAGMLEGLFVPRRAERAWRAIKLLHLFLPGLAREAYAVLLRERAEALRISLQRELHVWLLAIKRHLEGESSDVRGPTSEVPTVSGPRFEVHG